MEWGAQATVAEFVDEYLTQRDEAYRTVIALSLIHI